MSTLTKILIILLTISSLFLCGYVVQYVSSVDKYKVKFEEKQRQLSAKEKEIVGLNENLKNEKNTRYQLEDSKNKQIAALTKQINEFQDEIDTLKQEKADLLAKVESWIDIANNLTTATNAERDRFDKTFSELGKTKGDLMLEQQRLTDTSNSLIEKESLIDLLEVDVKRLTEEKMALENKLNRLLRPYGETAAAQKPVTPQKDLAQPTALATTQKIDLKGLVTGIDIKNSMAKISIGISDGVKKTMRFHVSRGSDYICDIVIIDVATEEAVGMLELIQKQPKIGDSVSTNL